VQAGARIGAQANDVTCVRRDLGPEQNDVEHVAGGSARPQETGGEQ
jgi:hypothetical protein